MMDLLATFVLAIRDDASYYSTESDSERLLMMLRFFPDPSQRDARLLNNCSDPNLGITPPMAGRS